MLKILKLLGYLGLGLFLYVWFTDSFIAAIIYVVLGGLLLAGLIYGSFRAVMYIIKVRIEFEELEQKSKCTFCGEAILSTDKFCKYCGKKHQSSLTSFSEYAPVCAFLYPVCELYLKGLERFSNQMELEEMYGEGAKEVLAKNGTTVIVNQKSGSSGTGVSGFVFSILALILGWIPAVGWLLWFLGALLSFIGLFFSGGRIYAILGFIISFIGIIVWGAAILAVLSAIGLIS